MVIHTRSSIRVCQASFNHAAFCDNDFSKHLLYFTTRGDTGNFPTGG